MKNYTDYYEQKNKILEVAGRIEVILNDIPNISLSYYINKDLTFALSDFMSKIIFQEPDCDLIIKVLENIIIGSDFRLAYDYLFSIKEKDSECKTADRMPP